MSQSKSPWLTYPKKSSYVIVGVLVERYIFLDGANGHLEFGPLAENARIV